MGGAVHPALDASSDCADDAGGSLAPFGRPLFAGVWLTNTVSNFGGQMQGVGAAWLMTSLTRDARTVSLVTGAALLPILLFSLVAGAVADAVDRRLVLLAAQLLMFAASTLLAWLTAHGMVSPASLIALTFLIGCGFAFNAPAWQAAVRELVPTEQVPAAISLNIVGFNLSRMAGPALGGIVVAWGGAQASFTLNAVSYLGLLAVLVGWARRGRAASHHEPEPMLRAIRSGIAHAVGSGTLRRVLTRVCLFGVALGALLALIPIVVRQLGAGPGGMGLVFGCSGGGAVLGALLANRLRARIGLERLLRLATLASAAGMGTVAWSHILVLTAGAEIVTGVASTLVYTNLNVLVQTVAPRALLGRVLSLQQMAALGGLAVGTAVGGWVAEAVGVGQAIGLASVAMLGMVALAFAMPLSDAGAMGRERG